MTNSAAVLYEKLVRFSDFLRLQGLTLGIQETVDVLRALNLTGFEDRNTVRTVMRTLLAASPREQSIFDKSFDRFFISQAEFENAQKAIHEAEQELARKRQELEDELNFNGKPIEIREDLKDVYAMMPQSERDRLKNYVDKYSENLQRSPGLYEGFIQSIFMKSLLEQQMLLEDAAENAQQMDSDADLFFREISNFKDSEIPRAYQLIDQVTRRINGEITVRRKSAGRASALDFKKTIRAGLSTGGALCKLKYRKKPQRKKRIVMLCDVSGSMLQFSEFAIRFLKSLSEVSDHSEIYLFSEQVLKVSPFALENMDGFADYVRSSGVWGRGTNAGRAIETVLSTNPPVLTPSTVLLIMSDAKSVDMARAESALNRARTRCGSVLWLNPIPESKWPYLKGVMRLKPHCNMLPCSTLDELSRACSKLM